MNHAIKHETDLKHVVFSTPYNDIHHSHRITHHLHRTYANNVYIVGVAHAHSHSVTWKIKLDLTGLATLRYKYPEYTAKYSK